ncbi:hypothetical protein WA026_017766 [Henosepilachna vigintioctopunctata]|uniref:Uncharacterized protein n=1 Tax=Henosepilachna vigintioctopunctata TaxID=420089 RepID=A0AAW1UBE3_9CUCU
MSKEIKPCCVFCFKRSEPSKTFPDDISKKCNEILVIRKEYKLSMSDAKVPKECNDYQKYHSKCYKTFSALPPKNIEMNSTEACDVIIYDGFFILTSTTAHEAERETEAESIEIEETEEQEEKENESVFDYSDDNSEETEYESDSSVERNGEDIND